MRKKRKYTRRKVLIKGRATRDDKIIKKITAIRVKNNTCWMDMLRLAYAAKPKQAARIMSKIVTNDGRITKWMSRLGKV